MPEISRSMHGDSVQAGIVGEAYAEYEIVTRQGEVGVSQDGRAPIVYSTTTQMWDPARAHAETFARHSIPLFPIADRGGVFQDGCGSGHRNDRDESNILQPAGVETVHGGHVPLGNEQQCHVLIYPPGEVGSVTITDRDMESLQPKRWLRDNVIDFYIWYLHTSRLSSVNKERVYFFNSFFFRSLVDSTAQGKIDYEQVRNWTGNVNLFEKKYIFIPVYQSWHWSLIIICHLNDHTASPYILHLDSLKGQHDLASLTVYIQNYISEAWKVKYQDPDLALFPRGSNINIGQPEVPQQDNGYDCGIYLLHYVELFLQALELASSDCALSTHSEIWQCLEGVRFESSAVSFKRKEIHELIQSLSQAPSTFLEEKGAQCAATEPAHVETAVEHAVHNHEGLPITSSSRPRKGKRKRDSNWSKEETSSLLKCKKEAAVGNGSRFCMGKPDATNWNAIAEEIKGDLGTMSIPKTGEQCRDRWDTLVKSYRRVKEHCRMSNKKFSELMREDRVDLKLATTLSEDQWYEVIDQICPRAKSRRSKSQKLGNVHIPIVDTLPRSLHNSAHSISPVQVGISGFEPGESSGKDAGIPGFCSMVSDLNQVAYDPAVQIDFGSLEPQQSPAAEEVAIPGFDSMSEDLKSTILNLIQAWPAIDIRSEMETACRWLAIVRDRSPSNTRAHAFELLSRNLLTISSEGEGVCRFELSHLQVYEKFVEVVRCKNLDYDIHSRVLDDDSMLSFESSLLPQRIQVLTLHGCKNLERVDLGKLLMLRSLSIEGCGSLKEVCGWENLSELGWLEIKQCPLYDEYPGVHCLPFLKEFFLGRGDAYSERDDFDLEWDHSRRFKLDFRHCVHLRRLWIDNDDHLRESGDLSSLKWLEELTFSNCENLESIVGLSEIHSLIEVQFAYCRAVERLPDMGHLKALAKLRIVGVGVETIPGLENLHSLTDLTLGNCSALKELPGLGQLRALTKLRIVDVGVEAIPGLENLHSLTDLTLENCSAQKELPGLGQLRALTKLRIYRVGVKTIPGLENLHSLTDLTLENCSALKELPGLGQLRALTKLTIVDVGVETIPGLENLHSLTDLTLGNCSALEELPGLGQLRALTKLRIYRVDVETIPGLENLHSLTDLTLEWCSALEELPGLGQLRALTKLRIYRVGVKTIPGLENLHSLTDLTLEWCIALKELPGLGQLRALTKLTIDDVGVEAIPGLENLHSLTDLTLGNCSALKELPGLGQLRALTKLRIVDVDVETIPGLENLHSLTDLTLEWCSALEELPGLGQLRALTKLRIYRFDVETIPGLENLHSLTDLTLEWCIALKELPGLGQLRALTKLTIVDVGVEAIPGLENLHSLTDLTLESCSALKELPGLGQLRALTKLTIDGVGVEAIPGLENLHSLTDLTLESCSALEELPGLGQLRALTKLTIVDVGVEAIPGLENLHSLTDLTLESCSALEELPGLGQLRALTKLTIVDVGVEAIPGLENLHSLTDLTLGNCSALEELPGLGQLRALTKLRIYRVDVETIPGLENLHSLTDLTLEWCIALEELPGLGQLRALTKLRIVDVDVEAIPGLENLHSLTDLTLEWCSALEELPGLGQLRALTKLRIVGVDVEAIPGLENLRSLTDLAFIRCKALQRLPYLGYLSALAYLDVGCSGVDEIPGVRELVNLKILNCAGSNLQWLPDLRNLPLLKAVHLQDTPLVLSPSSKYFGRSTVKFNEGM